MSHANVTVTRTVTTSHPSAIFLNVGYLKSPAGLLKIAQLILGGIVIGLILCNERYYEPRYYYQVPNYSQVATLFLLVMACTFFICTFILLLSCIFSLSTGGLISKTLYEFIYHLCGAILLFIASVAAFVTITRDYRYHDTFAWYYIITYVGFANFVLYLISTILAFREYRY